MPAATTITNNTRTAATRRGDSLRSCRRFSFIVMRRLRIDAQARIVTCSSHRCRERTRSHYVSSRLGYRSRSETQLSGKGARRDVVRAAEGGEEVVERVLVGQIDDRELRAPLVPVAMEDVVVAHGEIEEAAGSDARRIVVVVFRPGSRNRDQRRAVLRRRAQRPCGADRRGRRRMDRARKTDQPGTAGRE